jgi:hypothetical protein
LLHRCRWFVVVALVAALPAMATQPVRAATDHVTNCNSSGTGSLPAVVTAATAGDTIVFDLDCPATGPITLTTQITIGKNLTINGTGHTVVLSGGGTTRHFTVNSTFTLSLINLTLQNGNPGSGNPGGSIHNNLGTLSVTGCTFLNNVGGGTMSTDGGGAIHNNGSGSTLTIVNSTFAGNRTAGSGGGGAIRNVLSPNVTITGSTFTGNTSAVGGAIRMTGTVAITNSTFTGNRGTTGAGTFLLGSGAVTLTLKNVTVAGNSSGGSTGTGGVENTLGATVNLTNTIVASNTGASGNPDVKGTFTSGGHNLIGAVDGGTGFVGTDLTGTAAAPLDANLGPLASNGGSTQTMALLTGSPAIAAGDPAICAAAPVAGVDQRGTTRPATFCAIGAFEPQFLHVINCLDSGAGSLRDRVTVAPAGYTLFFTIDCPDAGPITLASQITIGKNLTIDGTGHSIVMSGGTTTRLITISSTFTASLNNLTLRDGNAGANDGGAIFSSGTLTVTNCTFVNNAAAGVANNVGHGGGAIFNNTGGTLTVTNSTFSGNHTTAPNPVGGAIYNAGVTATITGSTFVSNTTTDGGGALAVRGTVTAVNSTFSGNAGGGGLGGAIFVVNTATLIVRNSTLSGNSSGAGGGIGAAGAATVTNTILAGNTTTGSGPDASGTFTSGGHNLIGKGDGATGFTNGTNGDQVGTAGSPLNPGLGALANNGGPTQTFALQPGSLALVTGDTAVCAQTGNGQVNGVDQRGSPRRITSCAIGAYEPPFITAVSPNTGGTAGGTHATLTGGGFFTGATVAFGVSPCTAVTVTSVSALNCVVPAGSGTVNVFVTAGGSITGLANAYTYGTVNPVPPPRSSGSPTGAPNPLPNSRSAGSPSGSPSPVPAPRFG